MTPKEVMDFAKKNKVVMVDSSMDFPDPGAPRPDKESAEIFQTGSVSTARSGAGRPFT